MTRAEALVAAYFDPGKRSGRPTDGPEGGCCAKTCLKAQLKSQNRLVTHLLLISSGSNLNNPRTKSTSAFQLGPLAAHNYNVGGKK